MYACASWLELSLFSFFLQRKGVFIGVKAVASASLAGELIAQMTYAFKGALTIDATRVPLVLQPTIWSYNDSKTSYVILQMPNFRKILFTCQVIDHYLVIFQS